jgi:hypothetical protein
MGEWQPIETSPKDETWVLLYFANGSPWQVEADGMILAFWSVEGNDWFNGEAASNSLTGHNDPTHWMPLPEPPPQS